MDTYAAFARAYREHYAQDPNNCVQLGFEERLDELPDPSAAAIAAEAEEAGTLLARIDLLDRRGLGFDEELDLDLARLALEREVHKKTHSFNGRTHHAQLPNAADDVGDGIFLIFANGTGSAAERLSWITARIERIPDYLPECLGRLDTPVARWVAIDARKARGLPALFRSLVGWAEDERWPDRARLRAGVERAESALADYATELETLPTTPAFSLSDPDARRTVALRGIDKSFEELHRIARDFLAETGARVEELRTRLARKYGLDPAIPTKDLQAFLNARYRVQLRNGDLDGVLARYEEERARILTFIRANDLFPIPADQDMRILRTPEFMEPSIPAGAMMSPPPFRAGVRRSLVYLTLSAELLDEHTELSIPNMMIHEGIPGHHLQLSTAARHPSVVRKLQDAMDQAEGWTTMLEDYMLDQGYLGELADEARFIGKRDIARLGARVAIDLFFMTGERRWLDVGVDCDISPSDPFTAAGNLLRTVTGFVPGRVEAELNWYSQVRGYPLSYLTGNHLVWELKADVTRAQRGKLEGRALDRAFHQVYLEAGNMPVRFLRRVYARAGLL